MNATPETPVIDVVLSHLFLHFNLDDSENTRTTKGLVNNYLQIAAAAMEMPQETQMQAVCVRAKGGQAAGERHASAIKSARSNNKKALGGLLQKAMADLTADMMRIVAHVNKRMDIFEATLELQGARIATLEADVEGLKDVVLDLKSSVAKLQAVVLAQTTSQASPPLRGLAGSGPSKAEFLGDPSSKRSKYPLTLQIVYRFSTGCPCAPPVKVSCQACYYSLTFEHVLARARQVVDAAHPTSSIPHQLEMGYLCGKVTQSMLPKTIREFYATADKFMQVEMTIPVLVRLAAAAAEGGAASSSSEAKPMDMSEPEHSSEPLQSAELSVEQTASEQMVELAMEDHIMEQALPWACARCTYEHADMARASCEMCGMLRNMEAEGVSSPNALLTTPAVANESKPTESLAKEVKEEEDEEEEEGEEPSLGAATRPSKKAKTNPSTEQLELRGSLNEMGMDPKLVDEAIEMNLDGEEAFLFCTDEPFRKDLRASHGVAMRLEQGLRSANT